MNSSHYVDLQVNGYAGIDFNQDDLTADGLHAACQRLQADGVASIMATIITERIDTMVHRLARLVEFRAHDPLAQAIIGGIHIEGPFLSPVDGYRGAHPLDAIRPADVDTLKRFLDAAGGLTRIVTLAPEQDDGARVTKYLADQGVVVSAGHTNASLDELRRGIDAGLSMFTHLGNGCPMQMHRHDNIIQRALSLGDRLALCFIADGVHIAFHALRNYLRLADPLRAIIVTDCMAAAGLGPGRYRVSRWDVLVGEDLAARAPDGSHLIGSAMTMPQAAANLSRELGCSEAVVRQLTSENPRRALQG